MNTNASPNIEILSDDAKRFLKFNKESLASFSILAKMKKILQSLQEARLLADRSRVAIAEPGRSYRRNLEKLIHDEDILSIFIRSMDLIALHGNGAWNLGVPSLDERIKGNSHYKQVLALANEIKSISGTIGCSMPRDEFVESMRMLRRRIDLAEVKMLLAAGEIIHFLRSMHPPTPPQPVDDQD